MVMQKRKAISRLAKGAEASEALSKKAKLEVEDPGAAEEEAEEEEEEENISEKQKLAQAKAAEAEIVSKRTKELKSMNIEDLKELASSKGLELRKKDEIIQAVLKLEAKARKVAREHQEEVRAVVVGKKEELEAKSAPELKDMCASVGIKGVLSKQERVSQLLANWQANDGIDKAFVKIAHDARKGKLVEMDPAELKRICDGIGVDPLIKEVMVDRIIKQETDMGRFEPPVPEAEDKSPETSSTNDAVGALIAHEAVRTKEKEVRKQQEEAAARKMKDIKAKSVEELKKLLSKKGLEATGKKESMIEALVKRSLEEDAVIARKAELKSLTVAELKEILAGKELEISTKKDAMVEALLGHEEKIRDSLRAHAAKVSEASEKLKEELEQKAGSELKELCISKGLKAGVAKEDRIQRLVEQAQKDGQIQERVAMMAQMTRKDALTSMDKADLFQLCEETGADPFVKDIIIERILSQDGEKVDACIAGSASKRARVAKR